jgi:hypothetical protein
MNLDISIVEVRTPASAAVDCERLSPAIPDRESLQLYSKHLSKCCPQRRAQLSVAGIPGDVSKGRWKTMLRAVRL